MILETKPEGVSIGTLIKTPNTEGFVMKVDKEKIRRSIHEAELRSDKEKLDFHRVFEALSSSPRADAVKDLEKDTRLIEETKRLYYLDAPKSVKTTEDFINWMDR